MATKLLPNRWQVWTRRGDDGPWHCCEKVSSYSDARRQASGLAERGITNLTVLLIEFYPDGRVFERSLVYVNAPAGKVDYEILPVVDFVPEFAGRTLGVGERGW
jgi:hypothetical protein